MAAGSDELDALCLEAHEAIAGAATLQQLREVRARFLGRKGSVSSRLRSIGELPQAERKAANDHFIVRMRRENQRFWRIG